MTHPGWERFQAIMKGRKMDDYIIPVPHHKLSIVESNIDGEPKKDWIICTSPYMLGNKVVEAYAAEKSGLERWFIVAGYPYLNAGNVYEWRLRR